GNIIGYVGATGTATGPHLDYRVYRNGTAIDPLKIPTEPAEPIEEKNRAAFEAVKKLVLEALRGEIPPDSIRLTENPDASDNSRLPLPAPLTPDE
ncbi:MAG: M23 family metallopeptidase, partial [Rikenellaceae bacterium]|nr:M23 family metallopeptidase [Rikenellaceae bacterium]